MEDNETIISEIKEFVYLNSDPRTSEWLLMSSPFPVFMISISYLTIVQVSEEYLSKTIGK